MSYKKPINNFFPYIFISLSSFIILIPSFFYGFFGDDYSWMLQAKQYDGNLFSYIFSAAPYGYFRPVVKLFFLVWHGIFTDNALSYRVFILFLHIGCSLMVYHVFLKADYSRNVAWVGAIIFAVITCHSEALYSINSISEIFSALFILTGIFFLLSDKKYFSILFFTLALFSRESALCFLPIALIFLYRKKVKIRSFDNAIILIIPILFYFATYLTSHNIFEFVRYGPQDVFTINPLSMGYKVIHYFVNMMVPVKTFLVVFGNGEMYETLQNAVKDPGSNIMIVGMISILGVLFFAGIFFAMKKLMKSKEYLIPIAISLAALLIYLPMIPTAERFLYLPSIGICLLLALIWEALILRKEIFGVVFLSLIMMIYTLSYIERADYWRIPPQFTPVLVEGVHQELENDINDYVIIKGVPPRYYINDYTLPDMYEYYFEKRKTFRFDELKPGDDSSKFTTLIYLPRNMSFGKIN